MQQLNVRPALSDQFHRLLEYPWKSSISSYVPAIPFITPESINQRLGGPPIQFSRYLPDFLDQNWENIRFLTLMDPFRLGKLLDLLVEVQHLEGDVVECGTSKGGSAILLALAIRLLGIRKKVYVFDSFEGLPQPNAAVDKGYNKGMFRSSLQDLQQKLKDLQVDQIVCIRDGWFEKSIPAFLQDDPPKIALLHIDCDLYESTLDCMSGLYPLVSDGAAVIMDDFNDGCKGQKKAVLEVLGGQPAQIFVGATPQSYFFKKRFSRAANVYNEDKVSYVFDELLSSDAYLRWISEQNGNNYKAEILRFLQANERGPF